MSLGFLTESALLPSKAKAIKVDTQSLVDLRAVVFQKEQERDARKRKLRDAIASSDDSNNSVDTRDGSGNSAASRGFGRYAHLRAARRRGAGGVVEEHIGKSVNRGVEKRRRRDEDARELELDDRDDDHAWHRKSRETLERKARLYDEMANGGGGAAGTEWLVDFSAKPRADAARTREQAEITDEFGRTRVVAADSREYAEFLERQTRRESSSAAPAPDHRADASAQAEGSSGGGGSFVASQWEKRLNAQEKTYVQEVHASAALAKSALQDTKTRKQLRLERLRRQAGAEGDAASASASASAPPAALPAALSAEDEQAAAAKATAFLDQLRALV